MDITNEQADYLLKLPKKIIKDDKPVDKLELEQTYPFNARFELVSKEDDEFTFLWVIRQSKKSSIRVSLHYQENGSQIGLMRVDYNGGHINPVVINEFVPEKFRPYAAKEFKNNDHHIHYHVQGYKSLAWAIPLTEDDFKIKELKEGTEFNFTFVDIIKEFAKTVNIETEIILNPLLL
jgi:hypothetical protein